MNSLFQLFRRIRKNGAYLLRRPVFLALLFTFILMGLAFLMLNAFAKSNTGNPRLSYQVPEPDGGNLAEMRGIGIDLTEAQSPNLIKNPDFAPRLYKMAVPIARVDDHELISSYSASQSAYYGDGFFNGADLRLVRASSAKQSELGTAKVERHQSLKLGQSREFKIPSQESKKDWPIEEVAWRQKDDGSFLDSIAVGDQGLLITSLLGSNPVLVDLNTDHKIVAAFGDAAGYVCVSEQGEIFFSDADLQTWQMASFTIASDLWQASGVIRIGQSILVSGNQGRLLLWEAGEAKFIQLKTKKAINALCVHRGKVIAVSADGRIWQGARSEEAWQFEELRLPALEGKSVDWLQAVSCEGALLLSGTGQSLAYGEDAEQLTLINTDFLNTNQQSAMKVIVLSKKNFIVQIPKQSVYYTDNAGGSFKRLEKADLGISEYFSAGPDRLLGLSSLNRVSIHPLEASFSLGENPSGFGLEPGDVMILQQLSYQEHPDSPAAIPLWQSTESVQLAEDNSSLKSAYQIELKDSSISQRIPSALFQPDLVYLFTLKARNIGSGPAKIDVQLRGPFPEQTLSFEIKSKALEEQSLRFVMPRLTGEINQSSEIILSISGDVAIDRVFLAADRDKENILSAEQESILLQAKPSVLRLSALRIGSTAVRSEQWVDNHEALIPAETSQEKSALFSLEEGLRLCRRTEAQPWISIEAFTTPGELGDLIAYLAASIDEPFGQVRLEQGTAIPWSSSFEQIYLEFKDDEDVFKTIEEKLAFANAMKSVVEESPYYLALKNKLIFVDGMDYKGGRMLSNADFHAMDFPSVDKTAQAVFPQIRKRYEDYLLASPRQTSSASEETQELMRRLKQDAFISALSPAEQLYFLLYDYGAGSSLVNLDLEISQNEMVFELSRMLKNAKRIGKEEFEQASILSFQTEAGPAVFVWTTGEARADLHLQVEAGDKPLTVRYFDKQLKMKSHGDYRGDAQELAIMPGTLVIIS